MEEKRTQDILPCRRPTRRQRREPLGVDDAMQVMAALAGNDPDILRDLKASGRLRRFRSGQTIVSRDDSDTDVYCLIEGKGRVVVYSNEGHEIWIDDIGPGGLFGEMAALRNMRRTAEVRATTRAVAMVFAADSFMRLMEKHGRLAIEVSRRLVDRLFNTTQRMYELSALSATGRIYAELLRSATFEANGKEVGTICPAPRIAELARRAHASRETASRTVSDLERRGLVVRHRDRMIVVAPTQLGDRSGTCESSGLAAS